MTRVQRNFVRVEYVELAVVLVCSVLAVILKARPSSAGVALGLLVNAAALLSTWWRSAVAHCPGCDRRAQAWYVTWVLRRDFQLDGRDPAERATYAEVTAREPTCAYSQRRAEVASTREAR
jgi:hypothetical protein